MVAASDADRAYAMVSSKVGAESPWGLPKTCRIAHILRGSGTW